MAITIIQEKKKQRYLMLAAAVVIFATLAVIWFGFIQGKKKVSQPQLGGTVYAIPKVDIDWQMLESIQGQEEILYPFKEIRSFEDNFGRKNPFVSY